MVRRSILLSLALIGLSVAKAQAQPAPTSPEDFVAAAGGSDQYEIMAARVALAESRDPRIRAFARQMIREHEAALASLRAAAMRSGLKPPPGNVGGDDSRLLASLQSLRGAAFEHQYGVQQVLVHGEALATERNYARDGSDPDLRAAATKDLPMIERHLHDAQKLAR